jgi:hypothetical protein
MITQINVVVHNTMSFKDYLNIQVTKQMKWNIFNRIETKMTEGNSPIASVYRIILNKVIDNYNDANEPYEDVSMDESEVDWD